MRKHNIMMEKLDGKKTYYITGAMFVIALAAVMNGWGDAQMSAAVGGIAAAMAAMRAGVEKSGGGSTTKLIIVALLGLFLLGGCAALGTVDPATGTSPAQDIVAALAEGSSLFGPVIGTAVPLVAATLLSLAISLGKVKDSTSAPTSGPPRP